MAYGPAGETQTIQYRTSGGNYFNENRTYNNRAQLKEISSSVMGGPTKIDLQYVYNVGTNNGQIAQMNDVVSGEQTVYAYDSLKRLVQAQASVSLWGQAFGYDGWGNLLSKAATPGHSGTSMSLAVAPQSNQPTNQGFAFDGNGNATSLPNVTSMPTGYDVENRMGGDWYDQWNQPLERGGVWNEYGVNGERLGTYSYGYTTNCMPSGPYLICAPVIIPTQVSRNIYFGGRLIQSNGLTVATDRLGSARMDENGHRAEFFPYGEAVANSLTSPDLFATYARDSGTGLDYAGQRWYTSTYGRFTSSDHYVGSAGLGMPGSWNRYAYGLGDPINLTDRSGTHVDCTDDSCNEADCDGDALACSIDEENSGSGAAGGYYNLGATGTAAAVTSTLTFGTGQSYSSTTFSQYPADPVPTQSSQSYNELLGWLAPPLLPSAQNPYSASDTYTGASAQWHVLEWRR